MTAQAPLPSVRWTPNLVLEDALQLFSDEELCQRHEVSLGDLTSFRVFPVYRKAVAEARREIAEQGLTFRAKARLQAERFLDDEVPKWIGDADTPVKDKLVVLTRLVEWGELGPKPAAQQGSGSGFTFVLNLGGEQQAITVGRLIENTEVQNAQPISEDVACRAGTVATAAPEPVPALGDMPSYLKTNADLGE